MSVLLIFVDSPLINMTLEIKERVSEKSACTDINLMDGLICLINLRAYDSRSSMILMDR